MRGDFMTLFLFTTRHRSPSCADSIANPVVAKIAEIEVGSVAFAVLTYDEQDGQRPAHLQSELIHNRTNQRY
jgi:hypothetical protein